MLAVQIALGLLLFVFALAFLAWLSEAWPIVGLALIAMFPFLISVAVLYFDLLGTFGRRHPGSVMLLGGIATPVFWLLVLNAKKIWRWFRYKFIDPI